MKPANRLIPDDVQILDNGVAFVYGKDELDYLWYRLREVENGRIYDSYKVVRLVQLRSLPVETRTDTRILQKMQEVLWGLYRVSAPLDFIHLAAGIFNPTAVGVVQLYGIACTDSSLEDAVGQSRIAMAPLTANLKGVFRQIKLRPLDMDLAAWLTNAFATFRYAVSTIGHPDPRDEDELHTAKGARTAGRERSRSSFSEQQNEKFFRSMAAERHEFLWVVMASPVSSADLSRMLVAVSDDASSWKSRQEGVKAINFGLALPMMLSQGVAHSAQTGYGQQYGKSHMIGLGESYAQGHAHGLANSVGGSHTDSKGQNWGLAEGETWGEAHTVSHQVADSTAQSHNLGVAKSIGQAHTDSHSVGVGHSESDSSGATSGGGHIHTESGNWGVGLNFGSSSGSNANSTDSAGASAFGLVSGGSADSHGSQQSASFGNGIQFGGASSDSFSGFGSTSSGHSEGSSSFESWGTADTTMHSLSNSEGWGTSSGHMVGTGVADTVSHSTSLVKSQGWNVGEADTSSWGRTVSDVDSTSKGVSHSASEGESSGLAATQGLGIGRTLGGSFGLVPSVGASKSYKVYDEAARIVAEMLSTQALLLRRCTVGGGWLTDVYTLTETPEAIAVVEAAVRQAFGGTEDVVTAIQTRYLSAAEQLHLRLHATCFTPSTMREEIPGVVEAQRHATLMDGLMISTLTSPASMQLGDAQVVQEKIPDFAFYPNMSKRSKGRSGLVGRQFSTETGELTDAPVILAEDAHTHTIFQGDPRSGKSEAAYRVALTTWGWGNRVIVLEFGKGWDRFFNSPLPRERCELWQLQPDGVHPLRWPILAVPTLINPERYVTLCCENIAKAGQMGQVQIGLLQMSLRELYIRAGVLLTEEAVLADPAKNKVTEAEARRLPPELGIVAGQGVQTLDAAAAQALSVLRSRKVSLKEWIEALEAQKKQHGTTERERQALATVLFRLRELTFGQAGKMFGALADDEDASGVPAGVFIERLGMPRVAGEAPGFVVIEGGHQLGEFLRSFLLGLIACILYESAIVDFDNNGSRAPFATEIFWEEANKVLSGPEASSSSADGVQTVTPEAFVKMWRDGERYKFRNHPIVQNLSQLPAGIVPSCNNGFFFRSKDAEDQKLILTYIGRSPTGFVDQDYQRFLARMPQTYCIAKFGMSRDIADMEPFLMRAEQVVMASPTKQELQAYYRQQRALRYLADQGDSVGRTNAGGRP